MPRSHPFVPIGCDHQGRYPEAAHACSEFLMEPNLEQLQASDRYINWLMAAIGAVVASWIALLFYLFI